MEITSATATSLGEKLAGLELNDEEGALLTALLAEGTETEDAEVQGFGLEFEKIKIQTEKIEVLRTSALGPLPGAWKQPGGDGYLVITMEN